MNYFSDEDLARALRESRGLPPEPDETRSIQAKKEDDEQLREELASLADNPLGKFGRALYRLMVKRWPKAEESYDWVYAPGELDLIPAHESIDSASNKVKLAHVTLTTVAPVAVLSEPRVASAEAANTNAELESVAKEREHVQYSIHTQADVQLKEVSHHIWLETVRGSYVNVPRSQKAASGSDIVDLNDVDVKLSPSAQQFLSGIEYFGSETLKGTACAVQLSGPLTSLSKLYNRKNTLPLISHGETVKASRRPFIRVDMQAFDKFIECKTYYRNLFIDEAHRTSEAAADIKSALQSIDHALTKYKNKKHMAYTASPRSAWFAAVDYVCNIFRPKPENELSDTHGLHKEGVERVEWKLDRDSSSELALRGSAGHLRDYWFKLHNHQLSLRWQNKEEQTPPQTIFQVGSSEPVAAGEMMVTALENAHVDYDRAVELMGSLKEFVERQTQVH
ncbi:hypothetical protein QCL51_17850 [Pseudomonas sp. LTR0]|uniref:hypothetical protein n=1 Tax=Pseudomonas sp. LTR0 TaxID=3040601 RepID=UPI0030D2F0C0